LAMKKSKLKRLLRRKSVDPLHYRMGLLEVERQNFLLNPNFPQNVKMANAILVQSDIEVLDSIQRKLSLKSKKRRRIL